MASKSINDPRKSEEVDKINNPQPDRNDVDIFQDASDNADRATPSVTRGQQAGSKHDPEGDAEAEDPNKNSEFAQGNYDDEEPPMEYNDGQEDEVEEQEGRWGGYRQESPPPFNPDILPEQQEIQEMYLADVLLDLPPDLANNPDAYRRELVKRGVAEDLIRQQEEHLARFNANRRSPRPETSRWQTFPPAGNNDDNAAAWNATLPTRSAHEDQGPSRLRSRASWHRGAAAAEEESRAPEHQWGATAAPPSSNSTQQEPVVSLYASVRIPISSLVVVDESGDVLQRFLHSDLRIATIDPATRCLRVELRRRSGW